MNYFEFNETQNQPSAQISPHLEELVITGDEVIEVDEDHSITVDDVRAYIRRMHQPDSDAACDAPAPNVVSIRAA